MGVVFLMVPLVCGFKGKPTGHPTICLSAFLENRKGRYPQKKRPQITLHLGRGNRLLVSQPS